MMFANFLIKLIFIFFVGRTSLVFCESIDVTANISSHQLRKRESKKGDCLLEVNGRCVCFGCGGGNPVEVVVQAPTERPPMFQTQCCLAAESTRGYSNKKRVKGKSSLFRKTVHKDLAETTQPNHLELKIEVGTVEVSLEELVASSRPPEQALDTAVHIRQDLEEISNKARILTSVEAMADDSLRRAFQIKKRSRQQMNNLNRAKATNLSQLKRLLTDIKLHP